MNGKARARLLALGLKYQSAKEGLSCRGLGTVFGLSASEQMISYWGERTLSSDQSTPINRVACSTMPTALEPAILFFQRYTAALYARPAEMENRDLKVQWILREHTTLAADRTRG
jgi:hypothetical protein